MVGAGDGRRPTAAQPAAEPVRSRSPISSAERDEYLDHLRRLAADFDNYKKRQARLAEQQTAHRRASASCAGSCRCSTTSSARSTRSRKARRRRARCASGVALTCARAARRARSARASRDRADGEVFDPREHEALMAQPTAERGRGHRARGRADGLAAGRAASSGPPASSSRPPRREVAAVSFRAGTPRSRRALAHGAFFCALALAVLAGDLGPAPADRPGHAAMAGIAAGLRAARRRVDYVIEDGGADRARAPRRAARRGAAARRGGRGAAAAALRLLGSGGLFGYHGMYRSATGAGYAVRALTARDRAVLVLGSDRRRRS